MNILMRRWALLITLLLAGGAVAAQTVADVPPLQPDTPLTVTLTGDGPLLLQIDAPAGQVITLTARALTDDPVTGFPLDPVLEVLSPAGARLAYQDDVGTDAADGLQPTDARITRLTLAEAGLYTVRVDSFNGAQQGDLEVVLTEMATLMVLDAPDDLLRLPVTLARADHVLYTLSLRADETFSITVRDPRGLADPVLTLRGADGTVVAMSDDADDPFALTGLTLNSLDAHISAFTPPADGLYTLEIREFLGRHAGFELLVRRHREAQNPD